MQPTVLAIDDDQLIRQILAELLEEAGFRVVLAAGGEEGCRLACEVLPDVILVDLVMPDRDGVAVCNFVRQQPSLRHTPIILATACADLEHTVNPFQVGADDYLTKPFNRSELIARIKGNLAKKQLIKSNDNKARHYDALLEIAETVISATDAGTALKEIVRKISQHLDDVDRCSIALIRELEGSGTVMATTADLLRPAFRIDLKNYPEIRQVIATGKPLLIEDVSCNPLMADILPTFEGRDIGAILVFPVLHAQRVIGAMMVRIARRNGGIVGEDIGFCRLVSNVVVAALKSTNFFDLIWEEAESLRNAKSRLEADLRIKTIYESLFENACEGLMAFTDAGQVIYANRCLLEMVDYARTELPELSVTKLFGDTFQTLLDSCLDRQLPQQAVLGRFDLPFTTRDGRPRIFAASIGTLLDGDGLRVAAFRDVTEKRRIEEDLLQTKTMLEESNARLLAADRARAEFLNTAAHELRTPVTIVSGYCSLLAETDQGRLSADQRSYVLAAVEAADRLTDLINNLLDLSRLESGKMLLNARVADLVTMTRQFLLDYESLVAQQQIQLETEFPDRCPALFDEDKIYRVLVNLLSNAVKFTPAGGAIRLRIEEAGDSVHFVVEDTGKGIAADDMLKLFQEFTQIDKKDSRSGSGLGLYICRKIIESHQGHIWAESQPNHGSRFTFSLPKPL